MEAEDVVASVEAKEEDDFETDEDDESVPTLVESTDDKDGDESKEEAPNGAKTDAVEEPKEEEKEAAQQPTLDLELNTSVAVMKRQPHHKDAKAGITYNMIEKQYAETIWKACAYVMCNYSSLTMAISMGFLGRNEIASDKNNEKFKAKKGQINQLRDLVGGSLYEQSPLDIAIRVTIVNMLTNLLLSEEIMAIDLVDCLDDWMEENFSVLPDESSH